MLKIAAQMAVVVNLTQKNQYSMTQAQTIVMITATLIVIALTVIVTVVMVVVTMVMMLMTIVMVIIMVVVTMVTMVILVVMMVAMTYVNGDGNCSSEEHCDINRNEDDEVQFDSMMFQPIYDNASISLCAALCANMVKVQKF